MLNNIMLKCASEASKNNIYLLDEIATPSYIAISLTKLTKNYTGNCIRVRRSSDNAEQDIGFVDDLLDTASLISFVGANNGRVVRWYDQSGNNNYFEMVTSTKQPYIITGGNLEVQENKTAIRFNIVESQYMVSSKSTNTLGITGQPYEIQGVIKNIRSNPEAVQFYCGATISERYEIHTRALGLRFICGAGPTFSDTNIINAGYNKIDCFSGRATGTLEIGRIKKTDGTQISKVISASDVRHILGARIGTSFFYNGYMFNYILFSPVLSDNERRLIESSFYKYYYTIT